MNFTKIPKIHRLELRHENSGWPFLFKSGLWTHEASVCRYLQFEEAIDTDSYHFLTHFPLGVNPSFKKRKVDIPSLN